MGVGVGGVDAVAAAGAVAGGGGGGGVAGGSGAGARGGAPPATLVRWCARRRSLALAGPAAVVRIWDAHRDLHAADIPTGTTYILQDNILY